MPETPILDAMSAANGKPSSYTPDVEPDEELETADAAAEAKIPPHDYLIPGPSTTLFYTEAPRAVMDLAALAPSYGLLRWLAPRGDGHPVFVLPGFMATDSSTYILRQFLRSMGYHVYGWSLGRNTGPHPGLFTSMQHRLLEIYRKHGNEQVSIVGQSLGGIYAREISRYDNAKLVRQVISLGSPFGNLPKVRWQVRALFQFITGISPNRIPRRYGAMSEHLRDPLTVPGTAVYSRYDGVSHWSNCVQKMTRKQAASSQMENVEVLSSHLGMAANPAVFYLIADRLAQKQGEWKQFQPGRWMSAFFPKPEPLIDKKI